MIKIIIYTFVINVLLISGLYTKYFVLNQRTAPLVLAAYYDDKVEVEPVSPATEEFIQLLKEKSLDPVTLNGKIHRKPLTVQGRTIILNKDSLQIFEYPEKELAQKEMLLFSEAKRKNEHLFLFENILVFYMGNGSKIIESIEKTTE